MANKKTGKQGTFRSFLQIVTLFVMFCFIVGSIVIAGFSFRSGLSQKTPSVVPSPSPSPSSLSEEQELRRWETEAKRNPADPFVLRNLARSQMRMGVTGGAEKTLQRAIKMSPQDFLNYQLLGELYLSKGKTQQAISNYRKALSLKPKNVQLQLDLADSELAGGDEKEAEKMYGVILHSSKIPQELVRARVGLLTFFMKRKNFAQAEEQALALRQWMPSDPRVSLLLGELSEKQKKTDEAIQYYEDAKKASPDASAIENKLAVLYTQKGDNSKAIEIWKDLVKANPRDPNAKYQLALLEVKLGNKAEAKDLLQRAIKDADSHSQKDLLKKIDTALLQL